MGDEIKTSAEIMEHAARPRMHEVHSDDTTPNTRDQVLPKSMEAQPLEKKSPAQWAYERTVVYLKKFEGSLDDQHEVAMGFVGADAGVLRIEGMGYFDPDIVTFYGADPKGNKMQLVQHVNQLNVVFRALPKAIERKKPNRIGFKLAQDLDTA